MRYVSWLSAEVSVLLYVSVEIISNEYNIIQQQQKQQQHNNNHNNNNNDEVVAPDVPPQYLFAW